MHVYLQGGELPGTPLAGSWNPWLVLASYLVAALSAYLSLILISRIRANVEHEVQRDLRVAAVVALSAGVWAMHFIGMLAFSLPLPVRFQPVLTGVSFLAILAAVYSAIRLIRTSHLGNTVVMTSGLITGAGIALMHYLGMAAMQSAATMYLRADLLALSLASAFAASIPALWYGVRFVDRLQLHHAFLAALLMAVGICATHYIGMAATSFRLPPDTAIATDTGPAAGFTLDREVLASRIILVLAAVLSLSSLVTATDPGMTGRRRLGLISSVLAGVALTTGGIALMVVYETTFRAERDRLRAGARIQASLIEQVARFDARFSADDVAGGAREATLGQVRAALTGTAALSETGEVYLVSRAGDRLTYLVRPRHYPDEAQEAAAPERTPDTVSLRAVSAAGGSVVARDYSGERVIAGHAPVPSLNAALVIKIDLAEFRRPFVRAGVAVSASTLFLLLVGLWIARGISRPVVSELKEKHRLELELDFARQVQDGLLPQSPPALPGYDFAAGTVPARFVGGDFYDFATASDGAVTLIIGDVAGKGVSAALHMARLISDFRYASELESEPARILDSLNQRMARSMRQGSFVTALCIRVDSGRNEVRIANAGHHPPLLRTVRGIPRDIAPASGPPLGVLTEARYETEVFELHPGELIVAYTDGVTESRDWSRGVFGTGRLRRIVGLGPRAPAELLSELYASIDRFAHGTPRFDDMTLLAFVRMDASSPTGDGDYSPGGEA